MSNKDTGTVGEKEVCELVPCPNCKKKLMLLPANYPLFDLQCTGCSFRAQVKTVSSSPKNVLFGAGWDIMEKVLKSGYMIPPLFINFKWADKSGNHQQIKFYPFVPKVNIRKYQLSKTARRANYKMFHYTGMNDLPCFILVNK